MAELGYIRGWLFTTNSKRIGILYILTSLYFFIIGGTLALIFRTQLAVPENTFLDAARYNQLVTIHGITMVFLFITPLAIGLASYFIPIQVGAREFAFPRIHALSYWFYLFGGLLVQSGFLLPGGNADFGWTMYAPLNTARFTPQPGATVFLLGMVLIILSTIANVVNLVVTIIKYRAKGFRLLDMPYFVWGVLLTMFLMFWSFPVLLAAGLLLLIDRTLGARIFSAPEGGAILWDHLFWFFAHPEVYIVLLPALGLVLDLISTFSRRPLYAKKAIIGAMIVASFLSYGVYAHHMFMTGISFAYRLLHSFNTEAISIPFGVITLLAIISLARSRVRLYTPMLFALGSIFVFVIGGVSGVFNSNVVLDTANRGSFWVVGHFHYVMVGAALFGLFGGLYYWFPKITGRMYIESLGKLHFIIAFIGFNILFFPFFFLIDMPRRIYTYPAETGWGPLNLIATTGAFIFGLSHILMFANFLYSMKKGPVVDNNPWNSWTYEWLVESPPPDFNFKGVPIVQNRVLTISMMDGVEIPEPREEEYLTPWPFVGSLGLFLLILGGGLTLLGFTLGPVILVVGLALGLVAFLSWLRDDFSDRFTLPELEEFKEAWPLDGVHRVTLGTWLFILVKSMFFAGLLGAYLWVRTVNPLLPSGLLVHNIVLGTIATLLIVAASTAVYVASRGARMGDTRLVLSGLGLGFFLLLSSVVFLGIDWANVFGSGFTLEDPAIATAFTSALALAVYTLGASVALLYFIVKVWARGLTGHVVDSLEAVSVLVAFLAIVGLAVYGVTFLF